jgi:hypothetical protein
MQYKTKMRILSPNNESEQMAQSNRDMMRSSSNKTALKPHFEAGIQLKTKKVIVFLIDPISSFIDLAIVISRCKNNTETTANG